jgi:hypothetical protein
MNYRQADLRWYAPARVSTLMPGEQGDFGYLCGTTVECVGVDTHRRGFKSPGLAVNFLE